MGIKVFMERDGYKLIGDDRDIMLPSAKHSEVLEWCSAHGVTAEVNHDPLVNELSARMFRSELWRVQDEQQRTLFVLRWV